MFTEQDRPQHQHEPLPPVENNLPEAAEAAGEDNIQPPAPKKRNSGRSGPTTPLGVARSARNSLKHGACSRTLIIEGESEEAWYLLHDRWCDAYQTSEDSNSLLYDFVRKTAQAEWLRIRCQHNYDIYVLSLGARSPFNWTPEEIKKHDLHLRYKNSAERAFHRENRALEQHYKLHRPPETRQTAKSQPPQEAPEETSIGPGITFVVADPDCPTGYRTICKIKNGIESRENEGQPFTPPDPLPPDWPKFHFLPKPKDADAPRQA